MFGRQPLPVLYTIHESRYNESPEEVSIDRPSINGNEVINMSLTTDLAAYDPNGQLAVIVEVKGRMQMSRSWATKLRQNMMERCNIPNARFFLLALPDRLYL